MHEGTILMSNVNTHTEKIRYGVKALTEDEVRKHLEDTLITWQRGMIAEEDAVII